MRKSDVKLSGGIFGRGLAARQLSSGQNVRGIILYMYGDLNCVDSEQTVTLQQYNQVYCAEELCYMAAKKLKLSPITAPLLALTTHAFDVWCRPNELIHCSADLLREFIVRVRFIPSDSVISRLPSLDAAFFNYLFLQMRSDFINDHIVYRERALGQEYLLGLGVIDMVRYGKQNQIDLSGLRKLEPQEFIPHSAKGNFKFFWDKKRLQFNFWPHLQKEYQRYESDSEVSTKLTYMKSILNYAEHYGMETFQLPAFSSNSSAAPSVTTNIVVKPHDAKSPGLTITQGKDKFQDEFYASFSDLMDISISEEPAGRVHINRQTGMPKVVQFAERSTALSFVALVDGYYRLQVDYHHHLCKDVESPTVNVLRGLRSHGPVSREWASNRLLERSSRDSSFNYLLRQSDREFGGYTLVCLPSCNSRSAILLHITYHEDTQQYQLIDKDRSEPKFSSMHELMEYYKKAGRDGKFSIQLNKCVPPSKPLDAKIYLCRQDKNTEDSSSGVQQQRAPEVCLVSSVKCLERLGEGQFTEVFSSLWDKDATTATTAVEVAVKRLKDNAMSHQQYFTHGVHKSVFWHHPTIVTTHAVCLASPLSHIIERASLGSLDKYLLATARTNSSPRVSHLVLAAEQIAQALCYLDGHGEVHGNIRCRNVLVFKHELKGSFTVKLGDVGLVSFYNSLPLLHAHNVERMPWIAPECYNNLSSISMESDLYAFGITLYEMFTFGNRPFSTLQPHQLMDYVTQGNTSPKPDCCPDDIYATIKSCCDLVADNRDRPLVIIRNIRSLLTKEGDIYNDYNDLQWLDKKTTTTTGSMMARQQQQQQPQQQQQQDTRGSDAALSSSAAVADNELNCQLACSAFQRLHVDVTSANGDKSCDVNGVVSPVSELSSTGWGDDSRTPLLRQPHNCTLSNDDQLVLPTPTSPTLSTMSAGDVSATLSDSTVTTELLNSAGSTNSLLTAAGGDEGRVNAIQSRPLPAPPSITSLDYNRLQFDSPERTLGQGHYGEVLRGNFRTDSGELQEVAVKRLKQSMYKKFAAEFEKEFRIMINLKHPNIVRIIGKCLTDSSQPTMLLVMEFVSNGCLREYLKKNESRLVARDLLRFGREIAQGMVYLSSQKIVHRDLATRNVLVTSDVHMKISDFGLSRALDHERDYYKCSDTSSELPAPWCAPEALMHRKFSEKSDVWSYGVTLWEIYSYGQLPQLCAIEELPRQLHQGKRLRMPKGCNVKDCNDNQEIYRLMLYGCWQYYGQDRKSFTDILTELKIIESRC